MRSASSALFLGVALVLTGIGCGSGGSNAGIPAPHPSSSFALDFDGVDDVASTLSGYSINTFTIEAWVKPTSVTANGSYRGIAGRPASFVLAGDSASSGKWLLTQCSGPCSAASSPAGNLTVGTWQHLAGVYDGAMLTIYRNGVLVANMAKAGNTTNLPQLFFGRWTGSFAGLIDEVRLWDVSRTQPQIQADMGSILTGSESNLVGYWRFEEGAGQTSADATAAANTAQLGTTAGADADDPTWANEGAPVS